MKIVLILLVLTWQHSETYSQLCSRPIVKRRQAYIYRSVSEIKTNVLRCLYNDTKIAYSDISNNCISAFVGGKFTNKYDDTYNVKKGSVPVILEEYTTLADPLKNVIVLRSGTVCRYDRGFCYDPREPFNYAAVWTVVPLSKEKCSNRLEIFNGFVDIWIFVPKNLTYLFYYDSHPNRSFTLKLSNSATCYNREVWYTDERGYIVSFTSLSRMYRPIKKPSPQYFHLKSKEFIAEAILKDCDLQTEFLDFDRELNAKYLIDPENLKIVLKLYQNTININKQSVDELGTEIVKIENYLSNSSSNSSCQGQSSNLSDSTSKLLKDLSNKSKEYALLINGLKLRDEELFLFIQRILGNITDLKRSINDTEEFNKYHFEQIFMNYKDEINEKYSDILKENKNIGIVNSNLEKLIFNKLTPLLASLNNTCLLKNDRLRQDVDKLINDFEQKMISNLLSAQDNVKTTIDNKSNSITEKIKDSTIKIKTIEGQLQTWKSELERYRITIEKHLSNARDTITLSFQNVYNRSSTIEDNVNNKFNVFMNLINKKGDTCLSEIQNVRNNITQSFTALEKKFQKQQLELSDFVGQKIATSENAISQLTDSFTNFKESTDKAKNNIDSKLKEIERNITNSLIVNKSNVEDALFKKVETAINEVAQKSDTCTEQVNDLKYRLAKSIDSIKGEISEKFTEVNNTSNHLEKTNANLLKKADLAFSEVINTEHKITKFNADVNVINQDIKANRFRLEQVETLVNDTVFNIDKTILDIVHPLLDPLKDLNKDQASELKDMKNILNETINDLREGIKKILIYENENIKKSLESMNNSLFKQITFSDLRINNLENNVSFLINNFQNKVEDSVLKKIDPLVSSIDQKYNEYAAKINEFQENTAKSIDDIRTEIIQYILDKSKSIEQNITDIKNNLLGKVKGLEEATTTYQENLKTHSSKVQDIETQIKEINKRIEINNDTAFSNKDYILNLDKRTIDLTKRIYNIKDNITKANQEYQQFVNKSLENNSNILKQLQNTVDTTNNKIDVIDKNSKDFDIRLDKLTESTKHTDNNIKLLQEQIEQNSNLNKDIIDLKNELNKTREYIKINEKVVESLRDRLDSCENNKIIEELKNEVSDIKNNFQNKQDTLGLNVQKQLEKKDEEIAEIKAELQNLLSCCNENKNKLKQKEEDIKQLNDTIITARETTENEYKMLNNSINKLLEGDGDVPTIVF